MQDREPAAHSSVQADQDIDMAASLLASNDDMLEAAFCQLPPAAIAVQTHGFPAPPFPCMHVPSAHTVQWLYHRRRH